MKTKTDEKMIDLFLSRGVENLFPSKSFVKKRLEEGKQLTMYLGIDPTGPTLHLGHIIPLRKLRQFQDLGHKVILLIGDFTGMIGDPTDKSATRQRLTREQVLENAKLYKKQASQILRFDGENPAELKYNSEWLAKMTLADFVELQAHYTEQQMMERDMFANRKKEAKPIYLHEFSYPLMQGFDAVAMDVDGEVGGNDQTFNMLVGRTLMKEMKQKEKFVVAMKLLVDPSGKKMGKTEGNMITLADSADEMFGKVMSWTDGMILGGFELLTDAPLKEVEASLKKENPRDVKMHLAQMITSSFHGEKAGTAARETFIATFQKHETPEEIPELKIKNAMPILDLLVAAKFVSSKSEARRVLEEGGVKLDGEVVSDIKREVQAGSLIQKGKRHFVHLTK